MAQLSALQEVQQVLSGKPIIALDPPHRINTIGGYIQLAIDEFYDWSNSIVKFNPVVAQPFSYSTSNAWGLSFYAIATLGALYAVKKYAR